MALALVACGDNDKGNNNPRIDAAPPDIDAPPPDIDAPPDVPDGIQPVRDTADGTGLDLAVVAVTVTYLKPQIGSLTNDPAGFTVQHDQTGPGLFVAVDPATLSPVPAVGDVVSFKVNTILTTGMQKRVTAISDFTRHQQGTDVTPLAQNVSAAADLVTAVDTYESEIVTFTGTLGPLANSGAGFQRATLTTAGITGDANLQFRVPQTLIDAVDMVETCGVTATNVPVGRFNAQTQIGAFNATDFTLTGCPAPVVVSAVALSATSVRITFSRNVLASSVAANGSQFTFDNGLVASAAVVAGRTVTVTTGAQAVGTTFTVTVAATVTDLQGSAIGATNTGTFGGFVAAATVRINEVNANIGGGCDLIEIRVIESGSLGGFKLTERNGGTGELNLTFPAMTVLKNDFVVVHLNSTSTTCNPGGATTETVTKTDQLAATFPGNFDTAFDIWDADTGLTNTDNVFTLRTNLDVITDALFASDDPAGLTAAAATETAAAAVGAASQWDPILATYIDTVFRTNAADDLNGTDITAAGTSIQRINNADTNNKADWTTGVGVVSTFGALNAGQTAL
ncbi:MAG: Ig-like domain-containing protein [Kofleriaceae bacterium]